MDTSPLSHQVGITNPFFYLQEAKTFLAEHRAKLTLFPCTKAEEIVTKLRDSEVILTTGIPYTRKVLTHLHKCKGIIRMGIGVDNFDLDAATERGIYIANVPDFYVEDVATMTVTFILALTRKVFPVHEAVKQGTWKLENIMPLHRPSCTVVGLLGFGRISKAVIERLTPLGFHTIVHDPYVSDNVIKATGADPVTLDRLLSESDFLSIHCPLTKETENLINEDALNRFKKNACLINTARGGIVDEKAVLKALQEGRMAGAAFDALLHEPPEPDNPLISHPRVIASPHIGWYSEESRGEAVMKAAAEAVRILSGKVPLNLVNRDVVQQLA